MYSIMATTESTDSVPAEDATDSRTVRSPTVQHQRVSPSAEGIAIPLVTFKETNLGTNTNTIS